MDVLASRILLEQRRASKVSYRGERNHAFGGIVMEASCGMWWIGGTALVNGDEFLHQPRGGSRGGGSSISVGLVSFCSGVATWQRESSRRQ